MHNLKILTTAVALLFVTPVFAQEMGGATGPGSASGYEPTYNNGYYNGYEQAGHHRAGAGALDANNAYALSRADGRLRPAVSALRSSVRNLCRP
jgi:hypothetical protein